MNKKTLSLVMIVGLLLGNFPVMSASHALQPALEKVVGKKHAHNLKFYRDEASAPYGFWTSKVLLGAVLGGAVGCAYSVLLDDGNYVRNCSKAIALTSALLPCYSFVAVQERVKISRERIKEKLQEYTIHKNIKSLPDFDAMMVFAAYEQDIECMKKLTPHVLPFLEDTGVWQVLVELYYDDSEQTIDKELKAVQGQQSIWSGGPTATQAMQQAKEKLNEFTPMEPKLLQRRVELLKEKIGYNDL